jgi:flavin reductase (DIM6/NTAB) family NADH-FMN oxidoreductase RutF
VSIHSEHPFLPPTDARDPVRRLRGRLPLPVSVWTTELDGRRVGWAVSSMLLGEGEPAEVLGLLDEDAELADALQQTRTFAVSLLGWAQRNLADAFAGVMPAPGGAFRLGQWTDTTWGPVLAGCTGWVGARLVDGEPGHAGWSLLVRATVEHVQVDEPSDGVLGYLHGRYRQLDL